MSTTSHAVVNHQSLGDGVAGNPSTRVETLSRRFRRGEPCAVCAAPVTHTGRAQRYCGRECTAIAHTLLADIEIAGIVSARKAGVAWTAIAAELSVSASTAQRACARSGASVDLPPWVEAEQEHTPGALTLTQQDAMHYARSSIVAIV